MQKSKLRFRVWQKILCMIGVLGVLFTGFSLLAAAKPPAGGVIAGKVYRLKNKGSGKYLNLCGGSDTTGKNINQFKDDGTDTLKWRFIEGAGDYVNAFKIQPILSSTRVVDVQRKGQPIASGGNIQLYSATDDISQHFVFKDTGDGDKSVYICPYTNQNVYMTANGDSNGTHGGTSETSAGNVFVKSSTGTNYQKWFVEETQANPMNITAGTYYIRNYKSNLYMGITSSYNVEQQNFTGASTQQWVVSYDTNGYYTLKIKSNTNYRLDVDNAWDENGTNIKVMTHTGYDAQLFRVIPSGGGTYRISPKHSTLRVVDVNGGYTTAGANIHLWNYVNAAQQRWIFERVDTSTCSRAVTSFPYSKSYFDAETESNRTWGKMPSGEYLLKSVALATESAAARTAAQSYAIAYPVASAMLLHFLNCTGAKVTLNSSFILSTPDISGDRTTVYNIVNGSASALRVSGRNITYGMKEITTVSNINGVTDWKLSVNRCELWGKGTISASGTKTVTLYVRDYYDWEAGMSNIFDIAASMLSDMHYAGIAREYPVDGSAVITG